MQLDRFLMKLLLLHIASVRRRVDCRNVFAPPPLKHVLDPSRSSTLVMVGKRPRVIEFLIADANFTGRAFSTVCSQLDRISSSRRRSTASVLNQLRCSMLRDSYAGRMIGSAYWMTSTPAAKRLLSYTARCTWNPQQSPSSAYRRLG